MFSPPAARAPVAPRLLDQVRERVRYLHYSLRTEEAYIHLSLIHISEPTRPY